MPLQQCLPSELDIFGPIAVQSGIVDSDEIEYFSVNTLDKASVIEFNIINASADTYLDLSTVSLFVQLRAVKSDGEKYNERTVNSVNLDERKNQPSAVNNMLASLIKSVNVYINNVLVSSCPLYCYKNYIDTILNYGSDAADTQLALGGFFNEDIGEMNDFKDDNTGAKQRRSILYNSSVVNLHGKLTADIFSTPRLLLNGLDLKIILTLNSDEFFFHETGTSKLNILKSSISVKHCKINPNILLAHHKLLNTQNANYSFQRANLRTFTIPTGLQSIQVDNIVNGILPSSLVFGFIENDSYNGKRSTSPYNFKPLGLESFTLYVNGVPLSKHPIVIEKDGVTKYMHAFRSLYQNLQILSKDCGPIPYEFFKNGAFLLPINLNPTENGGALCSALLKQGTIKVDLKFYNAITNTLTMLVYMETPAMFTVDQHRNVTLSG